MITSVNLSINSLTTSNKELKLWDIFQALTKCVMCTMGIIMQATLIIHVHINNKTTLINN